MNCKFINRGVINALMFAAGAAIGSAVTWKIVKTRYERIVREEIESVKEVFADRLADVQNTSEETDFEDEEYDVQINWDELEDLDEEDEEDDDLNDYDRVVNKYTNKKGGAENMGTKPYVINPYDFGEIDDYRQFELTYYADGILEDEDYNVVNDADELIGEDSLNTFGQYEDDSVFVRNDHLRADFQILKDYRTYEEARGVSPDQVGDE